MSNHRTFTYPPSNVAPAGPGGAPLTSEIVVTEDHATEAIQIVVRAIEFLRVIYCGGARNDAFAVPPRHVAAVEESQVPRRPAGLAGAGDDRRSPTTHRRTGSDVSSGRATPSSQRHMRTTSPSQRLAGPPRPYDTISCPESARGNPTMATGLHAAVGKVSSMPFFTTVRRSGAHNDKNAAPFVLLVRIGKCAEASGGWYGGGGKKLEVIEEWEFHFVKVRPNTRVGGSSGGSSGSVVMGGDGANSSIFRPAASTSNALAGGGASSSMSGPGQAQPSELQHALGLAPSSMTPNDPAKLRDVLHFLNMKALEAIDTFTIDELRTTPELTFDISIVPSERGTPLCHSTPDGAKSQGSAAKDTAGGGAAPAAGASVVGSIGSSIASFWRR
jgi:hypothetical protein